MVTTVPSVSLEQELHRQLDNSWIASSRDQAEIPAIQSRGRVAEIRVIGKIEGFRAELQRHSLADRERSGYVHVQRENPRTLHVVVAQIAVRARGSRSEGAGAHWSHPGNTRWTGTRVAIAGIRIYADVEIRSLAGLGTERDVEA